MELNDKYWTDRYQNRETSWDIGEVSRPIKEYIDQLQDKNVRILIPGCGNAYEAAYLVDKGFQDITLIDISEVKSNELAKKFEKNAGVKVLHEVLNSIHPHPTISESVKDAIEVAYGEAIHL